MDNIMALKRISLRIGYGSIKVFDSILSTPMNILAVRIILILLLLSIFVYFYKQYSKNQKTTSFPAASSPLVQHNDQ